MSTVMVIAGAGTLYRSIDNFTTWGKVSSGVNKTLSCIVYGNTVFIAVGESGSIVRSTDDGVTWTKMTNGDVMTMVYITYANNVFIAVGTTGTILRSIDNGLTWTKIVSGDSSQINGIACSNSVFVAVSRSGTILRSIDNGLTWASLPYENRGQLNVIVYNNNALIIIGATGTIMRSTDNGLSWKNMRSGVNVALYDISYNDNVVIVVGTSGTILRSIDNGLTWTKIVSGLSNHLMSITYANTTFIIVGYNGTILRSIDDGLTWTKIVNSDTTALMDIEHADMPVNEPEDPPIEPDPEPEPVTPEITGSYNLFVSDNGSDWVSKYGTNNGYAVLDMAYDSVNGGIYGIQSDGNILTSGDNSESYWLHPGDGNPSGTLVAIAYQPSTNRLILSGSGLYKALAYYTTPSSSLSWVSKRYDAGVSIMDIACVGAGANSTVIAISNGVNPIHVSSDGAYWTSSYNISNAVILQAIAVNGATCVVVGDNNTILYSLGDYNTEWSIPNDIHPLSSNLYGICGGPGSVWVAVGADRTILRSTNIVRQWAKIKIPATELPAAAIFKDIIYLNGIWYIGTSKGILKSTDDGLTWTVGAINKTGLSIRRLMCINNRLIVTLETDGAREPESNGTVT